MKFTFSTRVRISWGNGSLFDSTQNLMITNMHRASHHTMMKRGTNLLCFCIFIWFFWKTMPKSSKTGVFRICRRFALLYRCFPFMLIWFLGIVWVLFRVFAMLHDRNASFHVYDGRFIAINYLLVTSNLCWLYCKFWLRLVRKHYNMCWWYSWWASIWIMRVLAVSGAGLPLSSRLKRWQIEVRPCRCALFVIRVVWCSVCSYVNEAVCFVALRNRWTCGPLWKDFLGIGVFFECVPTWTSTAC